ncbi:hypothetical protein ES705_39045 [subsurface metagenome]
MKVYLLPWQLLFLFIGKEIGILPEKIEIILDYDGYKDPKIKDVELTRVNGYRTKIVKEGEKMEEYKLVNLSAKDAREVLKCLDYENVDIKKIIDFINKSKGEKTKMTNLTDDEKKFTEEEKKVLKYMDEHKGVSYRDAALAALDSTEPKVKKEPTEEEIKKREQLKAVENYISANPRSSYRDAVRVILQGEELTLEEKLIEEYQSANPGSSYKEAVIESLSLLKKEPKKEE